MSHNISIVSSGSLHLSLSPRHSFSYSCNATLDTLAAMCTVQCKINSESCWISNCLALIQFCFCQRTTRLMLIGALFCLWGFACTSVLQTALIIQPDKCHPFRRRCVLVRFHHLRLHRTPVPLGLWASYKMLLRSKKEDFKWCCQKSADKKK